MGCGPQKPVSKLCLVQEESLDWLPRYYVILLDHCVLGCVPSQVGHAEGIVKPDSEERCACVRIYGAIIQGFWRLASSASYRRYW